MKLRMFLQALWTPFRWRKGFSTRCGSRILSARTCLGSDLQNGQLKAVSLQVVTADIDEKAVGDRASNPENLVLELARAKAAAIHKKLGKVQTKALLITCDQVVVHNGKVLEKPVSEEEVGPGAQRG